MLFYNLIFQYRLLPLNSENPLDIRNDEQGKIDKWKKVLHDMNGSLDFLCEDEDECNIFATHGESQKLYFHISCGEQEKSLLKVSSIITNLLIDEYDAVEAKMKSVSEISVEVFQAAIRKAENSGYIIGRTGWIFSDMGIDYFDNTYFKLSEILSSFDSLSLEMALKKAGELLAPSSFSEELHRIYSSENEKKFYGHPVHYKITAGSKESAHEMMKLLVSALYSNKRIPSIRINSIYNIHTNCYDEKDVLDLFERAKGTTVAIELSGIGDADTNYASAYEEVIEYLSDLVVQYKKNVLFIFIEISKTPGFSSNMMTRIGKKIDVIELVEGAGDRVQALEYLNRLADTSCYAKFKDQSMEEALPRDKECFMPWEIHECFQTWCNDSLKRSIYRAYDTRKEVIVEEKVQEKADAYGKLQAMIGLREVKEIVDQILASYQMQKARKELGLKSETFSCHMLFTGNPGSAKTTVARLLASILKAEGILPSGAFVECGRSDLVGKYVGWTAKTVASKFEQARGGVLFIDEAYALVDDANSFGDEAINTIVQEMENNRDSVIVIFAGYPEKMMDFLDKNEGLRSRIAFHIDFPDYNAEELTEIIKLMAREKGYQIDIEIEKKCMDIFRDACCQPEFGNGRYARNLLEQAIMKQSMRIFKENKGKTLDKKTLMAMDVSDFEVNVIPKKEEKPVIGFVI